MSRRGVVALVLFMLVPSVALAADQPSPPAGPRVAQLGLPLGESADWRQWDSFLTHVVKKLGADLAEPRRERLREMFLDSRYQLVQALSLGSSDPVPRLFLDAWSRLGPIVKQALPELPRQTAAQYTGFISAMDGVTSLGGFAQEFGLLRVPPDVLRRAAGFLGTPAADPLHYTLDVDAGLRSLLGLSASLPTPRVSPALEQDSFRVPATPSRTAAWPWFTAPAFAADDRLNQWVPNGGPRQLGRYRTAETPAVWKRVDDAFWTKFRAVSAGQELGVKSCFGQ